MAEPPYVTSLPVGIQSGPLSRQNLQKSKMGSRMSKRKPSSRSPSSRKLISTASHASSYYSCASSIRSSEYFECEDLYDTIDDSHIDDLPARSNLPVDLDVVIPVGGEEEERTWVPTDLSVQENGCDLDVVIPVTSEEEEEEEHVYQEIGDVLGTPHTANSPPPLPTRPDIFAYANVTHDDYMRPTHCADCHKTDKDFVPVYENGLRVPQWSVAEDLPPLFVIEKPREDGRLCRHCGGGVDLCPGDRWCTYLRFHVYENAVLHLVSFMS